MFEFMNMTWSHGFSMLFFWSVIFYFIFFNNDKKEESIFVILKSRLAKGEITQAQFQSINNTLKEVA